MSPLNLNRRIALVATTVVVAVGGALGVEVLLSLRARWPFAHSDPGHVLGWLGLAVISLAYVYPWKKRHAPKGTWPKPWFTVHMVAGVLGPLLILVHSGWHLHAGVPVLALLTMALVVVSGVVGKAIHRAAVRLLSDRRRVLAQQGLPSAEIELALYDLAAQEEAFRVWQIIHAPLAAVFIALTILHIVGALYFGGV